MSFFKGQKNPAMPREFCITSVLPLKVLCEQVILHERAKKEDFQFLKSILISDKIPGYNECNTMNIRNNGQNLKSKSYVTFTPLLDQTPSDTSTVLTTMIKSEKITSRAGQNTFTADQQLYRVALEVMWTESNRFQNFIPRVLVLRIES